MRPPPEVQPVTIPPQRTSPSAAARTVVVPGTAQDLAAVILILTATGWRTDAVRLDGNVWRVQVYAAD